MSKLRADITVAAVDLGKWTSGLAVSHGGVLVMATEVSVRRKPGWYNAKPMARALFNEVPRHLNKVAWVVEDPQDYPGKPGISKDLAALRRVTLHLAELTYPDLPHLARPFAWKGNVPKKVHWNRLLGHLDAFEERLFALTGKDGKDAVGLLLWYLGRTGRGAKRLQ